MAADDVYLSTAARFKLQVFSNLICCANFLPSENGKLTEQEVSVRSTNRFYISSDTTVEF